MQNELLVFLLTFVVQVIMLIIPMVRMRSSAMYFTMKGNHIFEKSNHLYTAVYAIINYRGNVPLITHYDGM